MKKTSPRTRPLEASFTLLETVIAIGIVVAVVVEVIGAQGNIVYFSGYSRRINEASWLAKRIMAQVEYHWHNTEFKNMDTKVQDQLFDGMDDSDYTYNLEIKDWKLPIMDLLSGGVGGADDGEAEPAEKASNPVQEIISKYIGNELLKTANVEVSWPEGARRNSVSLTYLLTNQRRVDEAMLENRLDEADRKIKIKREQEISPKPTSTPQ